MGDGVAGGATGVERTRKAALIQRTKYRSIAIVLTLRVGRSALASSLGLVCMSPTSFCIKECRCGRPRAAKKARVCCALHTRVEVRSLLAPKNMHADRKSFLWDSSCANAVVTWISARMGNQHRNARENVPACPGLAASRSSCCCQLRIDRTRIRSPHTRTKALLSAAKASCDTRSAGAMSSTP